MSVKIVIYFITQYRDTWMRRWMIRIDTDFHWKNTDSLHEIVTCLDPLFAQHDRTITLLCDIPATPVPCLTLSVTNVNVTVMYDVMIVIDDTDTVTDSSVE